MAGITACKAIPTSSMASAEVPALPSFKPAMSRTPLQPPDGSACRDFFTAVTVNPGEELHSKIIQLLDSYNPIHLASWMYPLPGERIPGAVDAQTCPMTAPSWYGEVKLDDLSLAPQTREARRGFESVMVDLRLDRSDPGYEEVWKGRCVSQPQAALSYTCSPGKGSSPDSSSIIVNLPMAWNEGSKLYALDIDGDYDTDLLLASEATAAVTVFYNNTVSSPERLREVPSVLEDSPLYKTVFLIQARTSEGLGSGTAFLIMKLNQFAFFLTARHVAENAEDLALIKGRSKIPVEGIWMDRAKDIALLRVPLEWFPDDALGSPLTLEGDHQPMDKAYFFGFEGGAPQMKRYFSRPFPGHEIGFDIKVKGGMSGGPVLNESGVVVGMVVATSINFNNTLIVPVDDIKTFLGQFHVE